jgi:hypothetical protein
MQVILWCVTRATHPLSCSPPLVYAQRWSFAADINELDLAEGKGRFTKANQKTVSQ